jgi:hypothetical protein
VVLGCLCYPAFRESGRGEAFFGKGISRKAFSKGAQVEVVGRTTVEFESDVKGAKGRPKARATGRADYEYLKRSLETPFPETLYLKRLSS